MASDVSRESEYFFSKYVRIYNNNMSLKSYNPIKIKYICQWFRWLASDIRFDNLHFKHAAAAAASAAAAVAVKTV